MRPYERTRTMDLYSNLNPPQLEAVTHGTGPLLILAGAGSGKTRVLTHRIAHLIEKCDVDPYRILAITFTNKAAKEMRERVNKIVDHGAENIWVSTFHSSCVRILRRHIDLLGYTRNFAIYDTDDQKRLMKDVLKYLQIDNKRFPERSLMKAISSLKDELVTPQEYEKIAGFDYMSQIQAKVYKEYQRQLMVNNALDFDDIICKTVELFQTYDQVLSSYQARFRYVLVDEYQDTNTAQFRFINLIAQTVNEYGEVERNLCVVGDDDQSIYKFRGANIKNILDFESHYPDATVIRLEQNYRSTKGILEAANAVIENNKGRKRKRLWTDNEEGEPVHFNHYDTDLDEAENVVKDICNKVRKGKTHTYNDFAILYRTNAQSRVFEERLFMKNVPYKIIGSINFYQRKEIKDLICYLKTIDNGSDGISVKRIINVPRRGIGATSVEKIDAYAFSHDVSFYEALKHVEHMDGLSRSAAKVASFVGLVEGMRNTLEGNGCTLKALLEDIIETTGYIADIKENDEEEVANDRVGNINELINKIAQYEKEHKEASTLSGFLEEIALIADIDNLEEDNDKVVLMTLHSAKGLEFPHVYLCGMEDGVFPSYMSLEAEHPDVEIEEERRLCYVGITRAMKHLSLSAAKQRMVRGETRYNGLSMFISEIPRYLLKYNAKSKITRLISEKPHDDAKPHADARSHVNAKPHADAKSRVNAKPYADAKSRTDTKPYAKVQVNTSKDIGSSTITKPDYDVGDTVTHVKFGTGIVTGMVRGGKDYEVTVDFEGQGVKKMMSTFARLYKM